jgi:fatty acid desaturase
MNWLTVGVTVLMSVLLILVEHWLPWRKLLGRELPRLAAYVLGVLALALPLTVLFLAVGDLPGAQAAAALWLVILFCGLATILAYTVDHTLELRAERDAADGEFAVIRSALRKIEEDVDDQGQDDD